MAESRIDVLIRLKDELTRGLKTIRKELDAVNKEADELDDQSTKNVRKEYDRLEKEINDIKSATERTNAQLDTVRNAGLAIAGLGAALAAPFLIGVRAAAKFSKEIAEVGTLVPDVVQSNEELRDTVKRLSNEFGTSRSDIAQGLYQAISSGALAGAEANEVLRVALITARGGVTSVTASVDALSTVMNAFGLAADEAEGVADKLFVTVKNGRTTIDELSRFLFQAAPISAALGIKFEELNAALVTLTKQGVPTRVAFTQIRAAVNGLIRDTPELNAIFDKLGGVQKVLAEKGLAGALKAVAEAADGDVGVLTKLLGSIEGVGAVLGLTGAQMDEFTKQIEAQINASGDAQEAADEVAKSFGETLSQSVERVSNLFESLGQTVVPVLQPIIDAVGQLAVFLQKVLDTKFGAGFAAFVAVLGLGLVAFGSLVTILAVVSRGLVFLRSGAAIATRRMKLLGLEATKTAGAVRVLGTAMRVAVPVLGLITLAMALFAGAAAAAEAETDKLEDTTARLVATFNDLDIKEQVDALNEQKENVSELTDELIRAEQERDRLARSRANNIPFFGASEEDVTANATNIDRIKQDLKAAEEAVTSFSGDLENVIDAELDVAKVEQYQKAWDDATESVTELKEELRLANLALDEIVIPRIGPREGAGFLELAGRTPGQSQAELNRAIEAEAQQKSAEVERDAAQARVDAAEDTERFSKAELERVKILAGIEERRARDAKILQDAIDARIVAADKELEVTKSLVRAAQTRASLASREEQALQSLAEAQDQIARDTGEIDEEELIRRQEQRIQRQTQVDLEGLQARLAATRTRGLAEIEALKADFANEGTKVTQEQIDNAQAKLALAEESILSGIRTTALASAQAMLEVGAGLADALITGFEEEFTRINSVLQRRIIQLQAELEAGALTQTEFAKKIREANDQAAASFEVLEQAVIDALSKASGPEADALLALLDAIQAAAKDTERVLGEFEQRVVSAIEGSLGDFFETVLNDLDSVNEAFTKLLQDIGTKVKRLIAEKLANKLIESLFGDGSVLGSLFGSGGGSVPGAAKGGYITQAARGGFIEGQRTVRLLRAVRERSVPLTAHPSGNVYRAAKGGGVLKMADGGGKVRGPGTKLSDSIPAMLSAGEYVIKAASVDRYGLQLLEAINRGLFPKPQREVMQRRLTITRPRKTAFASGGFVGSTPLESQSGAGNQGIQNAQKAANASMTLEVNEATLNLTMRDFLEREFGRIMATR